MQNGKTSEKHSKSLPRTELVVSNLKKIEDGWGGQKTKKPAYKAIRKVERMLETIEDGYMPWPRVTAVPTGGVVLTWVSATRDIMMVVDSDGDVTFNSSLKNIDKMTHEVIDSLESEGPIPDLKSIDHLMAWYCMDKSYAA